MTLKELNEREIKCWADNDGGLWYYDPHGGGRKEVIEDDSARVNGCDALLQSA